MEWPAFLLVPTGLGLGAVRAIRGPGRVRWTLTIAFPLLYYDFCPVRRSCSDVTCCRSCRLSACSAAAGAVSGVSLLRRFDIPRAPRTAIIAAITAAALLPPAWQSLGLRADAGAHEHGRAGACLDPLSVPKGASIVIETQALLLSPKAYKAKNVPQLVLDSHFRESTPTTSTPASTTSSPRPRSTEVLSASRRTFRISTTPTRASSGKARK